MFLHLMRGSMYIPAVAIGVAFLLSGPVAGQQNSTPPEPPRPQAEGSSSDKSESSAKSEEDASDRNASDQSRNSTAGRSASGREDRSSSSARDTARDSASSQRDRSTRNNDDEDDRSATGRSDALRSRDEDDDSDRRGRDRRDARSFSRDADEDRFRDRDEDDDSDSRYSSRSSRDDYDRDSDARDRLRDGVRETARDVRDTVRDARDAARETVRDARSTARSVRDSVSRNSRESRQEFDVQTARAADVGIWFNRSTSNGLVISDVATTGPIARLGFREGDRIVSVDGYRVSSERQFVQDLFYDDIRNERVPVVVYRNGAQRTIYVEPATLVEHYTISSQNDPLEKLGLVLDDRYTDRLVVWKVIPRTPAYYAGIRTADVITTWDATRVTKQDQLVRLVQQAEDSGDEVRLTIYRGQQPRQLEVEFPQVAARAERRTSYRPALEQDTGVYTETYPAVEGTVRPGVIDRPGVLPRPAGVLPRPGILPRNR